MNLDERMNEWERSNRDNSLHSNVGIWINQITLIEEGCPELK